MDADQAHLDREDGVAMYQSHWGLRDTPFSTCLDPRLFYESPTHEEALARLHFLVERHRPLGLLVGESGSGKSLLLEVFARQIARGGRAVVNTSLLGLQSIELLSRLAAGLGCATERSANIASLWQAVSDRLAEHRYEQRDTVVLCDDADQAEPELLTQILRLVHLGAASQARLTVVLAARGARVILLGHDLLQRVDLRVDVEPWERSETEQYVRESLARAGNTSTVFDNGALARLQLLSHGVPRRVNQLADLALIAGAGQGLDAIDAEVVQSAYEELSAVEV